MFFRQKRSGNRVYLQIVENQWVKGRSQQRVIATIGRLDQLQQSGQLEGLLESGAKFAEASLVLTAHREGRALSVSHRRIGPALIFGRLWNELQLPQVIEQLLAGRRFDLPMERILFLTVLHRLFDPGSDRSCVLVWKKGYEIPGTEEVELHQVYRAMAWLGEPLAKDQQAGATPFSLRCVKDEFEEVLFARRRNLFSHLDLVFFDTTSIYFEGEGGDELGEFGHSKDNRPDRKQMIVGVVLDGEGRPLCCELWPGNVTDVKTLVPVVDRLRLRFQIRSICIVADRGMISKETIRGHVFCSFLALLLRKELQDRLEAQGDKLEWAATLSDLAALQYTEVNSQGKRFLLRSDLEGMCAAVFRAVSVAIPPSVQRIQQGDTPVPPR
jgi:hypothetical protein